MADKGLSTRKHNKVSISNDLVSRMAGYTYRHSLAVADIVDFDFGIAPGNTEQCPLCLGVSCPCARAVQGPFLLDVSGDHELGPWERSSAVLVDNLHLHHGSRG
jgi:hypothetical protein